MRILFATMQYGRSYLQGTERYLGTLGRGLRKRGHEVAYLAGDPLGLTQPRGVPPVPSPAEGLRRSAGEGTSGTPRLGDLVDLAEGLFAVPTRGWMTVQGLGPGRLARWLGAYRPDLVHVANPAHIGIGIMAACRQLEIPLVVTAMDFWWICPRATLLRPDGSVCAGGRRWSECISCIAGNRDEAWIRAMGRLPGWLAGLSLSAFYAKALTRGMTPVDLLRWTRRNAILSDVLSCTDELIFPSRATFEAIGARVRHNRCRIIPYGLSDEWFASPRSRPDLPKPPEKLVVGYAGALLPHKGPHLLLEAVRRLGWKDTTIRLAGPLGDPAYMARLRKWADGLSVDFLGPVPPDQMPGFLRSLDVLAMTSLWPENLPFVVLEAQAGGVPVVASRLAGVSEQVGDERLLFEPGCVEGLAAALAYVAANPQAVRLGEVSTAEEMTLRTEVVYADAIRRHPAVEQ